MRESVNILPDNEEQEIEVSEENFTFIYGDMLKSVYDKNNNGIVDKATADGNGNVINTTYATKVNVDALTNRVASLENADFVTKDVDNLTNYYDKDTIDDKTDEIDTTTDNIIDKINNPTYTTTEGTDLTITNSRVGNMKFEFYGDTEQITTTGKNLFNFEDISSIDAATINNGLITSTTNATIGIKDCLVRLATNKYISVRRNTKMYITAEVRLTAGSTGKMGNLNDGVNQSTKTLNPTLNTSFQKYQAYINYPSDTNIQYTLIQITNLVGSIEARNIMITTSEDTTYEPYSRRNNLTKPRFSTTCKISYRS